MSADSGVREMEFCPHHRSSHFCVFNNHLCPPDSDSSPPDSEEAPDDFSHSEPLQRPLARVLERVETFNRLRGRESSLVAAPCPVLVSRLLSSSRATDHHRFYHHCQDCADFASSLSQALGCLLQLGNISQRLQEVRNSENQAEDDQEVRQRLHCCFILLTGILVLLLLLIIVLSLKLLNFI